jgi:hypothetical protein
LSFELEPFELKTKNSKLKTRSPAWDEVERAFRAAHPKYLDQMARPRPGDNTPWHPRVAPDYLCTVNASAIAGGMVMDTLRRHIK